MVDASVKFMYMPVSVSVEISAAKGKFDQVDYYVKSTIMRATAETASFIFFDADDTAGDARSCVPRCLGVRVPTEAQIVLVCMSATDCGQADRAKHFNTGLQGGYIMTERPTMDSGPCSVSSVSSISSVQLPWASDIKLPRSPACLQSAASRGPPESALPLEHGGVADEHRGGR
jgi:hypothetical protein